LTITDNNGDSIQWLTSGVCFNSLPNSFIINRNSSVAMDDWFFTPPIMLNENTTYAVNFYYRGSETGSPGRLELKWGTAPDGIDMSGGLIWNDTTIQSYAYLRGTAIFTPAVTGVYYLGWHGCSPAGNALLSIDDITVNEANVTWNGSVSGDWGDPYNWTPNGIPDLSQAVTIPYETPNNPLISAGGMECRQLMINSGALVSISNAGGIIIYGDLLILDGASLDNQGLIVIKGNLDNQNTNK
jgi:hypothetical protein